MVNETTTPIYLEGECWITRMSENTWKELLNICNGFIMKFCSDMENAHQMAKNIKVYKSIMFRTTWTIWREYFCVKVNGGGFILGLKRVFTKHMLCDENGIPRKFTGRLGKYDEINRNGSIYIDEFGKNPIYYHGPHMKSAET